MAKFVKIGNKRFETYENKKPSIWTRFKAGAKEILKKPTPQPRRETTVEQNGQSIPLSQYERQIYEAERKKVLIEEARRRAMANAHRPPQPKQEGFWKRMMSETPEQKRKAQGYLQGKSILQHIVNPSKNRNVPEYVDIDKLARQGMGMMGLGGGIKPKRKGKFKFKNQNTISQINKLMGL
jgi:hypothetical protein